MHDNVKMLRVADRKRPIHPCLIAHPVTSYYTCKGLLIKVALWMFPAKP